MDSKLGQLRINLNDFYDVIAQLRRFHGASPSQANHHSKIFKFFLSFFFSVGCGKNPEKQTPNCPSCPLADGAAAAPATPAAEVATSGNEIHGRR